jgi:DNA-binding MarR family transcriptional regulator
LAERSRSADDARVIVVRVTDAGAALQKRLYDRRVHFVSQVLSVFSPTELEHFASLLERMVAALDAVIASETA